MPTPFTRMSAHGVSSLPALLAGPPLPLDRAFLSRSLGLHELPPPGQDPPLDRVLDLLAAASQAGASRRVLPRAEYLTSLFPEDPASLERVAEPHTNSSTCPSFVLEINPSGGACSFACQYCLVTDGSFDEPTVVWTNYPQLVRRVLDQHHSEGTAFTYYFSAKTEAFSEPHLNSGVAHGILAAFASHFAAYPDSRAVLFIVTKAGPEQLAYRHEGEGPSILEALASLAGHVQINTSLGLMPGHLHELLEPNAPPPHERLAALRELQDAGLHAQSVLLQPILPGYLDPARLAATLAPLRELGVENIKPEFLTADPRTLALTTQLIFLTDGAKGAAAFLRPYLAVGNGDHLKKRMRLAPERAFTAHALQSIAVAAARLGMSLSMCTWSKRELLDTDPSLARVDSASKKSGYICAGFQRETAALVRPSALRRRVAVDPVRLALGEVTDALRAWGIPYLVCGGFAVSAHGCPRASHRDVDLLLTDEDFARLETRSSGPDSPLTALTNTPDWRPASAGEAAIGFLPPRYKYVCVAQGVRVDLLTPSVFRERGVSILHPLDPDAPPGLPSHTKDAITYVSLADLVALKLAAWTHNAARAKDHQDVLDLIAHHHLSADFVQEIPAPVRPTFLACLASARLVNGPRQEV